jgi:hypothetical protein
MNWKSTLLVPGAGVVATWLFSTATPVPAPERRPPAAPPPAAVRSDIEQQASRLQERLHPDEPFAPPSRNPFRFRPRVVAHAASVSPAMVTAPVQPPPPPPRPPIRLSGIATDTIDGTVVRTAILSTDADVLLLKEGESGSGYRVTAIDDGGVTLAGPDGSAVTLRLAD